MSNPTHSFVQALQSLRPMPAVFNPWRDVDPEYDQGKQSPGMRAEHLTQYLGERIGRARFVLCAEALGYQGGHFSGIAMTSERILLGHLVGIGVEGTDVIAGGGRRTSLDSGTRTSRLGFTEPTATIVWGALKRAGIDTREVVLWNAFALHPMKADGEWLTNRKPTKQELEMGRPILEQFLAMFPGSRTVAVGRVSAEILESMGVQVSERVRHPANGGATAFRTEVSDLLRCG